MKRSQGMLHNCCLKSRLFIAPLLLLFLHTSGQIAPDSIRAIIKQEVAAKRSKSIIVGIIDASGRQVFAEGKLSDTDTRLPDANTIYEIGSITKVFTSLLLADMSLKERLSLDDPVSKFLPAKVKAPVKNGKEISLLSLSTHRSGLPRNAYNIDPASPDNPYADYGEKQLYDFISHYELGRDIDSKWAYSNIGYTLLGHIESIAGHKDFNTLVYGRICKPLSLRHTFFAVPTAMKKNMAAGYSEFGTRAAAWDFPLAGGGGLRSNVNDMLTFAAANLGLIKTDLLPAMELTHISRAKKDGNDTYTTMGWTLANANGKEILFKDGGTGGYRTFIGIDKKNKVGVVVLSNTNNSVTDIGWHLLDSAHPIEVYQYPWALLDTLRAAVNIHGVDSGLALYSRLQFPGTPYNFNDRVLNQLGDELRMSLRTKEALKVYELNVAEYPKSIRACETLAEMHRRSGNKDAALRYFEMARELEPDNPRWPYMIGKLKRD